MKKTILSIILSTISTLGLAQENNNSNYIKNNGNIEYALKVKLGYSQLKINEKNTLNGNLSQIDFELVNRISEKIKIDYGLGYSEFNGNTISNCNLVSLKNSYIRIPINLLYSNNFSNRSKFITGIGIYCNYLLKSEIPSIIDKKNIGINFGASVQTGVIFNISDSLDFGMIIEGQTDFTKIKKDNINQRLINSSLISLNFIYKI